MKEEPTMPLTHADIAFNDARCSQNMSGTVRNLLHRKLSKQTSFLQKHLSNIILNKTVFFSFYHKTVRILNITGKN